MKEGPIVTEPQYICDVCGKKKPVSQMAGKCVRCGKYVCSSCSRQKGDKVYCPKHARACFIATAAYGTSFASEIDVLRKFRDNNLKQSIIGRGFIDFYYLISPPIAKFISQKSWLRKFARSILNPLVSLLKRRNEYSP